MENFRSEKREEIKTKIFSIVQKNIKEKKFRVVSVEKGK